MIYATFRNALVHRVSREVGLEVSKKVSPGRWPETKRKLMLSLLQLEATSPFEITASTVREEFKPKAEQKQAFSKPKRPGKRIATALQRAGTP